MTASGPHPRAFRPDRVPEYDRVLISEYDPAWPDFFQGAAELTRLMLGPHVGRIEHIGSTAVPGLGAKPVIDMLVEVPSTATATHIAMPRLVWGGQEAYWQRDTGHWFLLQRHPIRPDRTHHLHVVPPDHELWAALRFRDHLRSNPEVAARYEQLKRELAVTHEWDREAYTAAKEPFVREILDDS